jgi:hypothetical protein
MPSLRLHALVHGEAYFTKHKLTCILSRSMCDYRRGLGL